MNDYGIERWDDPAMFDNACAGVGVCANTAYPCKGEITDVAHEIDGDELDVHVTFKNTGDLKCYYKVYLYNDSAMTQEIDKEPDIYGTGVESGDSETIDVTTDWHAWDINDLGGEYTVELREDDYGTMDAETVSL